MSEDASNPWLPRNVDAIPQAIHAAGYQNLSDLLEHMPACSYVELVRLIGVPAVPIQLIAIQFKEAKHTGTVRRAAMDNLVRNIVEELPNGWGIGAEAKSKQAMALAGWSTELRVTGGCREKKPQTDQIIKAFRMTPPPSGWIPTGPDDPYIQAIFDEYWTEPGRPPGN